MFEGRRMKKYQDALENLAEKTYGYEEESYAALQELIDRNSWTSVSERLPAKPSQRVLVTLENGMVLEVWYINNKFKFLDKMNFEEVSDCNPVIAWQPLPEPYKEG